LQRTKQGKRKNRLNLDRVFLLASRFEVLNFAFKAVLQWFCSYFIMSKAFVGVVGFGSFGVAIADLLAIKTDVLIFTRNEAKAYDFNQNHLFKGYKIATRVQATSDIARIGMECDVIFLVLPSASFRDMLSELRPYLKPSKILIHGTKGFDLGNLDITSVENKNMDVSQVKTMSEVILSETSVVRVGCLSGPNLATEILNKQPTATVIGSDYEEVIRIGQKYLTSNRFFVFGSSDMKGAELSGSLKNIYALGSGILQGKGYGKNIQAMLLTRGLGEMIAMGRTLGSDSSAFLGTAGIGDLIATATSELSRNFAFGARLGKGEKLEDILQSMDEVVEGVRTLKIVFHLARSYKVHVPITNMIYHVIYDGYEIDRAINYLMKYPGTRDVYFLDN